MSRGRGRGLGATDPVVRLVPHDDVRHDGEVDVEEVVERFQTWVAQSDTVVFEGGTDTRIEWCAGPVEDLLGYSTDELIGTSGFDHLHPDDLQLATQVLERDDPVSRFDMRLMRKDGTTRWVRMTLVPVRDSAGAITKWRGGWRDIQAQHEAESGLTESIERLTAVLESASVGMCLVAPDGTFLEVNPAMCDLLDRDATTLLSLSWREITHPDDVATDEAAIREILAGRSEDYRGVKRYLRPDGQVIWGDLSVGCVRSDAGAVRYFVSQIVDISDSVQAHISLELERRRLNATLDSELDPRVVFEAVRDEVGSIVDFEYVQANARAPDYLGLPEGELIGMRLRSLFPSSAAEEVVEMYSRVVETGEPLAVDDYVYPSELYEGQERWYDVRGARLGDGLSLTWRDVTDRHETAARLAESEAHYRLLAEQTTDVVGIGDNAGVIRWLSPSITRALGWNPQDLVGRNFAELVHPDDIATVGRGRGNILADRNVAMQVRLRDCSGSYRWFDIRLDPQHAPDGSVIGRIARWRDVDSEVRAHESLLEEQQRLSEAMEAETDPRCIHRAVRDGSGHVTELRFAEANSAMCDFIGRSREEILGHGLSDVIPGMGPDRIGSSRM